jgi:peptide/nickel transport system permease protein
MMNAAMLRLIALRLALGLLTLAIVSALVFTATELLPGDVAEALLGQSATPQAVAGLRAALHLDQPAWTRFLIWAGGMLSGDPGRSLVNQLPVASLIGSRLPNSLKLAGLTACVTVPLALTLGITTAMWRGSRYDRIVGSLIIGIVSVPEFLIASLAVLVFAVKLRVLPALAFRAGTQDFWTTLWLLAMPIGTLTLVGIGQMARMTRAALVTVLASSYIEMARLKGAGAIRVVLVHALPNALSPIVNAVALSTSFLLGGVIIVETIFNYPGLAKLMVDAVSTRDLPLVQACAMLFCAAYLALVLITDVVAILANPRLRQR